jgi:hypothetical protein
LSFEIITAVAAVGTFLVIAATAGAAFVQLRHLSGSNSISALTESREILESAEFAAAQRFVAYTLPELLKDPAVREQLGESPTPEELRPMIQVGNFFESLGGFIRHGIVDRDIAISLWSAVVIRNWECLAPALAIMRRTSGPSLWEQFEYLTRISHEWTEAHQHGDYPPGVAHMPLTDVWLDADNAAENTAKSLQRG